MASWWLDPESAWCAKAARAKHHIDALEGEVANFLNDETFNIVPEAGGPEEVIYRLQMSGPVPIVFSAMIGDVLHNLRSALDCAAFEIARRHVNRELTSEEERRTAFPIISTQTAFDKFFSDKQRAHLYSVKQKGAIRRVQPGHLFDEIERERGSAPTLDRDSEVKYDPLFLLNRLSNIDKHRRLHTTVWWPGLIYWGSDRPTHKWILGSPPFVDGAILGRLLKDPEETVPTPELYSEIDLRLLEPEGASSTDVRKLLDTMHRRITSYVLPSILSASDSLWAMKDISMDVPILGWR